MSSLTFKFLTATFLTFLVTACHPVKEIRPLPGIENETVMLVVIPYAIELQHVKKLTLDDSSVTYGGNGNYIKKVRLTFSSQSILELRDARSLLVDVADGLLDALNEDPTLGPLISTYPLSANDLEICIKFESYHGLYVDKAYVHWVMLQEGRSFFYAFDLTNEFWLWDRDCECWHERVEPFYKSRQIVEIQRAAEKSYADRHPKPKSIFSEEEKTEPDPTKTEYDHLSY